MTYPQQVSSLCRVASTGIFEALPELRGLLVEGLSMNRPAQKHPEGLAIKAGHLQERGKMHEINTVIFGEM